VAGLGAEQSRTSGCGDERVDGQSGQASSPHHWGSASLGVPLNGEFRRCLLTERSIGNWPEPEAAKFLVTSHRNIGQCCADFGLNVTDEPPTQWHNRHAWRRNDGERT
jgi:hypothetical protein